MSRRGTERKNWVTLIALLLVLLVALGIIVEEFGDPQTKARLRGWIPGAQSSGGPVAPSNP